MYLFERKGGGDSGVPWSVMNVRQLPLTLRSALIEGSPWKSRAIAEPCSIRFDPLEGETMKSDRSSRRDMDRHRRLTSRVRN